MMAGSEKDRVARQTADLRVTFDIALSNKREYPVTEFKAFFKVRGNTSRSRRTKRKLGSKWHLDEVFLKIKGRAVLSLASRRSKWSGNRHLRATENVIESQRSASSGTLRRARVILTDKLRSYGAAKHKLLPRVIHRQSRYLNNRAENSHQSTRQRKCQMKPFKSPERAQRFLSAFDPIATHFRNHRHRISATRNRAMRRIRITAWNKIGGLLG